ncbi:site-specific integrase [Massilia sp. TS11]|uniref:site-specific integrase n=1 Tax=Massilia sp. TS11 TaxID=2908003 RepID=UPI001EDBCD78|nr:site-specific integrase [Massilia sp. TS11]MCG2583914.1 site-specific integrase [Massilia sp. TS11]
MAMVRQRGNKFELRVKHRLLPNKIYTSTFDSEGEARSYGTRLEALLAQGLLPQDLASQRGSPNGDTLAKVIRDYQATVPVSALDCEILDLLYGKIGSTRVDRALTYKWAEEWVRSMKIEAHLAPGTIRKRTGALARMLDWHLKRQAKDGALPVANPLRLLPKNYSTYNEHERMLLMGDNGQLAKTDVERDRRLYDGEEAAIRAVLRGEKRDGRQRPLTLPDGPAMLDLYEIIVNTAMRLREAYRLKPEHIRLDQRTIHVAASKTGAARDIPILPVAYDILVRRVKAAKKGQPIFPWWSGADDKKELRRITNRLSRAFGRAFAYAGCPDLTEHDLRHEATCRWVLMRDAQRHWLFRTEECMRITGHKDPRMFMRYVSLRGSDLAERLWTTTP